MDDEIVIGVELKNDKNDKNDKKNKRKSKKKNTNNEKKTVKTQKDKKVNNRKKQVKKSRINSTKPNNPVTSKPLFKWLGFALVLIFVIVVILCSPLFNIKSIEVNGNLKLSDDKIISLSNIQVESNMFKTNIKDAKNNIEKNAYVENASVKRVLPNKIKIDVEEREAKYMLQFADSYVYINNQGYMLEISNNKLPIPILIGFTTDLSNIKDGNRINVEDLKKMNVVNKLYEATKSNELNDLVSTIDISDEKNYSISLESEGKIVYLGDGSDLNTRMGYLKTLIEKTAGQNGEIFLNTDLNTHKSYFRPSSN